MRSSMRGLIWPLVLGVAFVGPIGPAAAQFYPGFGLWGQQNIDPYGGYLRGSADVINAQGQYMIARQQAGLERERVRQSRVDTRRKVFDNWLYERQMTPSVEDERERTRQSELRRARNNPPLTEIWSGRALNNLLDHIKTLSSTSGPDIPLSEDLLSHVNLTGGNQDVSIGLLRQGGQLTWPVGLRTKAFQEWTAPIQKLASDALEQAQRGPVSGDTLNDMTRLIDNLRGQLKKSINDMAPMTYIEARRYLSALDDTVSALGQPNVTNFFTKWQPRGRDVAELAQFMASQGLRFAPASPGNESAYMALHRALVAFDSQSPQLVASPPQP